MCYTSGTTGHPKGVLYTHRGIYLHCFCSSTVDALGICERDVILHIVPMFHANAWCVPFAGVMNGSTQIFGGPNPQPRDIIEIVHDAVPKTSVGKFDKKVLRERFKGWKPKACAIGATVRGRSPPSSRSPS